MKKLSFIIVLLLSQYILLAQSISFKETIDKDSLGMKNGVYLLRCNDFILIKGCYQNDKRAGKWEFYGYDNQLIIEGYYLNGEKNGNWRYYYNGILTCQIGYKMGLLNGTSISYYTDGKPREVYNYEKGKLNGEVKIYFANNYLSEQRFYKQGKLDSTFIIYDENNQKQIVINYKEGHPYSIEKANSVSDYGLMFKGSLKDGNGNFVTYDNSMGKLEKLEERNYVNSKLQGEFKYFYRGYEVAYGNFENGVLEGKWKFFNDLGQLLKKKNYKISDNYPIDSLGSYQFKLNEFAFEKAISPVSEINPKFFSKGIFNEINYLIYSINKNDNLNKQDYSGLNGFDSFLVSQFDKVNINSKGFVGVNFTINILGEVKDLKVTTDPNFKQEDIEKIKTVFSSILFYEPAYIKGFPINFEIVKSIDFR